MSRIRTRRQWGHPGPTGPKMRLPAARLYLHHSVTAAANGAGAVRTVANIGIQRFGRSSYSYAVTFDGTIYELQGGHLGVHTAGQNSTSLAVVLVGNFDTRAPSEAQLASVAWLYVHLLVRGKLRGEAPLRGHRDAPGASTACPGRYGYSRLGRIRQLISNLQQGVHPMSVGNVKKGLKQYFRSGNGKYLVRLQARRGVDDSQMAKRQVTAEHLGLIIPHQLREAFKPDGHAADELKARIREVIREEQS